MNDAVLFTDELAELILDLQCKSQIDIADLFVGVLKTHQTDEMRELENFLSSHQIFENVNY